MKYIVFRKTLGNGLIRETPILFPNDLTHSEVAEGLTEHCTELKGAAVVGAGEVACTNILSPNCHGKSETLNVKSRGKKDDAAFVMRDYHHGIISV